MAITHGHGNPNWTRDEVILALDLYIACEGEIPGPSDRRVESLSKMLREFPYHAVASRVKSFRNADGVVFKLQNIRKVATGKGLGNVSRVDRAVWEEFGDNPTRVAKFAALIREGVAIAKGEQQDSEEDDEAEDEFLEGKLLTSMHRRRERAPQLRKRFLKKRRGSGSLKCEICNATPSDLQGKIGEAIFEAHHILPLSIGLERITRLQDLALVCANCHRILHRLIAQNKRWIAVEEARSMIGTSPPLRFD
jgi:5-methylcytosine-specific restriction protein A